ncbi:RNA polymerase sigma-70 factor, ECF subfamily [Mesorhizobium albiziae]|uniref:RNA polymerase sigma-70 factor, ECF subfamily n=1 Tax=Neomesorhizobium albiziae TaxID=335020 RepID=A0A1I3WJL2_9HYPH|nr:RNA polymerase sigma factor SigJ [Mesorhizobium albiziae]GLS31658.1 RNA polymerase sigma factor SigJ [Mesorhizobium albiziae]SFK07353.1 RNA polymerase sigma-70 factor, ECF subfamily [Mesorhizobium albiziae]
MAERLDHGKDEQLAAYLGERKRLIRLAYRYLGSASEAEDAVQDAWLRFAEAEAPEDAGRYLSRIVTNLCLDRLKSASRRRETYVGPWLPEPIVAQAGTVDPEAGDAALDISFGVMRALELLSPLERAALFLHDLYDVPFEEIAETLQRSPAACRQMASRARKMLQQGNPRFHPRESDVGRYVASFAEAARTGSIEPLKRILARDVELVSDGGGKVSAAMNVLEGFERVARFLVGIAQKNKAPESTTFEPVRVNGDPGLMVVIAGRVEQIMGFSVDENDAINGIYIVRNPDKLGGVDLRFSPASPSGT